MACGTATAAPTARAPAARELRIVIVLTRGLIVTSCVRQHGARRTSWQTPGAAGRLHRALLCAQAPGTAARQSAYDPQFTLEVTMRPKAFSLLIVLSLVLAAVPGTSLLRTAPQDARVPEATAEVTAPQAEGAGFDAAAATEAYLAK